MKFAIATLLATTVSLIPLRAADDLPDGKGKDLVKELCSTCHGLDAVTAQHATKENWQATVDYMLSRGLIANDDEVKTIVEYLAKNFPEKPKDGKSEDKKK